MNDLAPVRLATRSANPNDQSRVDAAYDELRRRILSGDLPAGFHALEPRLADMLGMSRTPVRHALVRLAESGLVELRPRRGMRVATLTARDVREIELVLAAFAGEAVDAIARRGAALTEMAELDDLVAAMDVAVTSGDTTRWAEADDRFQRRLIAIADIRQMTLVANSLFDRIGRTRARIAERAGPAGQDATPAALVEAIRRGDAETAGELLRGQRRRRLRILEAMLPVLGLDEGAP